MLVGITGGIGAGKTAVLKIFQDFGIQTLDADEIVHELYAGGQPAYEAVRARWQDRIMQANGQLDRAALARIVFNSPEELQWLNNLIHPLVKARIKGVSEQVSGLLLCAVPLLYEVGWENMMSVTATVWCNKEVQRERLLLRGWSREEIDRRIRNQMDMSIKLAKADYGLINNSSYECLRKQSRRLLERLQMRLYLEKNEVKN